MPETQRTRLGPTARGRKRLSGLALGCSRTRRPTEGLGLVRRGPSPGRGLGGSGELWALPGLRTAQCHWILLAAS